MGKIKLENLDLNPFLLRLLGLNTPREIAEFMVSQRTERGVVTSYGIRIQTIAKVFATGTGAEGADIMKEKNGKRHYIQMKAGPNTPNKDLVAMINRLLRGAVRRNRGSVPLLGMTYGKRKRVSSIIQRYSEVDWLIGREFWTFISDDDEFAKELFKLIVDVADDVADAHKEKTYSQRFQEKVDEVAEEIKKKYGDGGEEMWQKLFEDNV